MRLAKDGENNLKLDVEAGDALQRVLVKSKRGEKEDDELPTIDLSMNPFLTVEEHLDQPRHPPETKDDDKSTDQDELAQHKPPATPHEITNQGEPAKDKPPANSTEAGLPQRMGRRGVNPLMPRQV